MLGKLTSLGVPADRIVRVAFHVDYFNKPWKDPFSDNAHSRREAAYNEALGRKDLYFTPMMMIDGRTPMLGSDQPKAVAALKQALAQPPGVALEATLTGAAGAASARTVKVTVSPLTAEVLDRDLLVGVAITEDPVTTKVPSGENAGKTLTEHVAVRKFAYEKVRFDAKGPRTFAFPVAPGPDWDARRCRVAVFVQDWKKGQVHQARSIPWTTP